MTQNAISGGRRRGAGVTDDAIERIRDFVASGEWGPGTRLPREADLELFEVRRMLEPDAAAMAARRADADVIADLRTELDRMLAAGDRADELVEADAAFHGGDRARVRAARAPRPGRRRPAPG
jgi:DNA-binding FadR family transcriptional regulator